MATPFTKTNLKKDGDYLYYCPEGCSPYASEARFVARFKYAAKSSIGPFATCLRKNITAEDFFARIDSGDSPLDIVESFGFVHSHIKSWLRKDGYPTTQEGYRRWAEDQRAAREAREKFWAQPIVIVS
jgi:hypothetical protein